MPEMPYRPKSERELPLWMTLSEAARHIHLVDECNFIEALRQLRMGLGDGDIPARWAADPPPSLPGFFQVGFEPLFAPDPVPTDALYWNAVLIFLDGDGHVIDQSVYADEKSAPPRPRRLFLLRSKINALWPIQSEPHGATHQAKTNVRKTAKQHASKEQIREAARELYRSEVGKKPPNSEQAERLIRDRVPGATRPKIRLVLREEEFDKLRWRRGQRK
jgi:hypothetical protein